MRYFILFLFLLAHIFVFGQTGETCQDPYIYQCGAGLTNIDMSTKVNNIDTYAYYSLNSNYTKKDIVIAYDYPANTSEIQVDLKMYAGSMSLFSIYDCSYNIVTYNTYYYYSYSNTFYLKITPRSTNTRVYFFVESDNAVFDIKIGHIVPPPVIPIQGSLKFDITCPSPLTKKALNVTWNNNQMYIPMTFSPLNAEGELCMTFYLENRTGTEAPRQFKFVTGSDLLNPHPSETTINGFYSPGQWTASQVANTITYDFQNTNRPGKGDLNTSQTYCWAYTFCIKYTPRSNYPTNTSVYVYILGDWTQVVPDMSNSCCNTPSRCYYGGGVGGAPAGLNGMINDPATLPLEWLNVQLIHQELSWSVNQDGGEESYFIEGSDDLKKFYVVDSLSAIKTKGILDYQLTVNEKYQYYRVGMINASGNKEYSKTVSSLSTSDLITVSPNPTMDVVKVYSPSEEISQVTVHTATGQLVVTKEVNSNSCVLDVSTMLKGVYWLRIKTMNNEVMRKIIVN
ncbi:MAG: T9SS type A sorting domain-containing protein [Cytophagaceae bacterium]